MENQPKLIKIFLKEGLPKGIREVSLDQWSGKAISGPRNKIKEILESPELSGPCMYLLIGEPEEGPNLNVYVGEADGFDKRILDHLRKKDWWQQVVIFFGNNNNPSKTGIQYLEALVYSELKKAGKCELKNEKKPSLPSIPKEDIPGLKQFFSNIELFTPLLGYDIFSPEANEVSISGSSQYIYCRGKGSEAKGILLDDGKVKVLKDSTATKENSPSFETHNYKKLKDELLKIGRLTERGEYLYFTADYVFDSLSAAAAVVLARSAQGPQEWKYEDGVSVKDSIEK